MTVISLSDIQFSWKANEKNVLDIKSFTIDKGQRVFLKGPSGSGKSTLLSLIAGVNLPQKGEVSILGKNINQLKSSHRDHFRADHMGYIFQVFNLLPYLSVIENVCLPCHFSAKRKHSALSRSESLEKEALRLLTDLKLSIELIHRPVSKLSIGQQQRVAAARALIGQPELVIADEPTSSLDNNARESFIKLLFDECKLSESTLLFVSHDESLAHLFDRKIELAEINAASSHVEDELLINS